MKKTIAIAALILGIGTSVFAAAPAKSGAPKAGDKVSFASLKDDKGFAVMVEAGKSVVIVYDKDGTVIFKDLLSKGDAAQKGYVITSLDEGNYTVEVKTGKDVVSKTIHVYDDGQNKSYFFMQE
jgi:hypothetical protein